MRCEKRSREIIEAMLASATEILDMDAAFVAELIGSRLYFRAFEGNAESFGLKEGESIPFDQSYCKRLIEGRISGIVRDAERDERVQDLEVTREASIGSYVGVPLTLSDGSTYGTLCCLSHSPDPWLARRDLELMEKLANRTVRLLERDELI